MPVFDGYGAAVKRLRKARELSQRAAAKLAKVNVMTWRRIEKQQGDTSLGTLDSVMAALGVVDLHGFVAAVEGASQPPPPADEVREPAATDDDDFVTSRGVLLQQIEDEAERKVMGALFNKQIRQRAEFRRFLRDRSGGFGDEEKGGP